MYGIKGNIEAMTLFRGFEASYGGCRAACHYQVGFEVIAHAQMCDMVHCVAWSFGKGVVHAMVFFTQIFHKRCEKQVLGARKEVAQEEDVFALVSINFDIKRKSHKLSIRIKLFFVLVCPH
jgi:hypothetical protein